MVASSMWSGRLNNDTAGSTVSPIRTKCCDNSAKSAPRLTRRAEPPETLPNPARVNL